jgi:hypothetical protein
VLKATKSLEAVRRLLGRRDYTTIKVYLDLDTGRPRTRTIKAVHVYRITM